MLLFKIVKEYLFYFYFAQLHSEFLREFFFITLNELSEEIKFCIELNV